ncbi:uncharacterized protein LOC130557423 [Triplophysa rosa]|uniref:Uncharacterized protein n=1 Tax=Triplophysa rosa TaxID=992332 RepID=A0A9W7WR67_TRIRA|nr:uncharacterized protein LOC130557423 [Triplophysa rosa]KAI7806793.1 hypothetical protein IRJ41_011915 [Triplophysa rosa]
MDSIISSTQRITTAEDMRNQTELLSYSNWEKYLTPAPVSIAILGELVFLSSKTDFSINKNSPIGGFKYIRYPESFRACLMQVCNSGWWAFNEAHKNMDQIRLHTARIPDYTKTAMKILFKDNDEVINAHLPGQLKNIQIISDECLKLSVETEDHFKTVINIIQELLLACMNSNAVYGNEMEELRRKLEEAKMREQSAQEIKRRTEQAMRDIDKELERARGNFQKALDSLPTGWNLVGMEIVGGIFQSINTLLNGLTSFVANPVTRMCGVSTLVAETVQNIRSQSRSNAIDDIISFSKSAEILALVVAIEEKMFVTGQNEIDWKNLYDQKEKYTKTDFIEQQFKRILGDLEEVSECQGKSQVHVVCKKGINICRQLACYAPEGKCDKNTCLKIIEELSELKKSARIFDSKSKASTQSAAISPQPPMMFKNANSQECVNPAQRASENARFLIEQNRAQLNMTMELREKCMKMQEENHKDLTKVLITMRNCELKEIDFKTTIEMLVKGMDAMGKLQQRWQMMVQFFQMVSNIVKTNLNPCLTDFVSTSADTKCLSYNAKLISKDLIYKQAFQASNIASLVHMISGTYTEVSSRYLMDSIGSLSALMTMDQSRPEFQLARHRFQNSCEAAEKNILWFVLKKKEEFKNKSVARQQQIERELLAILPPASPGQMERIQEAVQAGFSEDEAASYY